MKSSIQSDFRLIDRKTEWNAVSVPTDACSFGLFANQRREGRAEEDSAKRSNHFVRRTSGMPEKNRIIALTIPLSVGSLILEIFVMHRHFRTRIRMPVRFLVFGRMHAIAQENPTELGNYHLFRPIAWHFCHPPTARRLEMLSVGSKCAGRAMPNNQKLKRDNQSSDSMTLKYIKSATNRYVHIYALRLRSAVLLQLYLQRRTHRNGSAIRCSISGVAASDISVENSAHRVRRFSSRHIGCARKTCIINQYNRNACAK